MAKMKLDALYRKLLQQLGIGEYLEDPCAEYDGVCIKRCETGYELYPNRDELQSEHFVAVGDLEAATRYLMTGVQ
ncbi:MAG: hypothetical protein Q4B26_00240 [Eubacteriales bacterium]|nr:hypothetical protein [Eubacteriales bacterium]